MVTRLFVKIACICGLVMAVFMVGTHLIGFSPPVIPARGDFAYTSDMRMLLATLFTFFILASYTIDHLVRGIWLVNAVRRGGKFMCFPSAPMTQSEGGEDEGDGIAHDRASVHYHYWLSCYFIGKVTEPIQHLVFYSFSVWILFIFSRSQLFDGWHTPFILYMVFLIYAVLIAIPAIILRYSAERVRSDAVGWFDEQLIAASEDKDAIKTKQLEIIKGKISDLKMGAFAPFSQQPLVEAAMALIGSVSGLILLEQSIHI